MLFMSVHTSSLKALEIAWHIWKLSNNVWPASVTDVVHVSSVDAHISISPLNVAFNHMLPCTLQPQVHVRKHRIDMKA